MKKIFAILMFCSFAVLAEPIDINKADAGAIAKSLKGVGPKKAEAIVQYRKEHGDFKTLKDFENVKGIGEKTALANEKEIIFSDSAATAEKPADKVDEKTAVPVEKAADKIEEKAVEKVEKPDPSKKAK